MRLYLEYPKWTTCRKAKSWLKDNNVDVEERHIVDNRPTKEELTTWINSSGLPLKKFFNTSGKLYKELNIKEKFDTHTEEELIEILATNGMLVKRPILVYDDKFLVGFKENEYEAVLKGKK